MSDTKNEIAWRKIFEKYKILDNIVSNGQTIINASQINEFREARLMTKFDHKSQLPKIFSDNNLAILPISRGDYCISNFRAFHDFEKNDVEITKVDFPHFIESLDYKNITSEATAINCAFVTNILRDFTGEQELHPTVSGRMSSSSFQFRVKTSNNDVTIDVRNSQVEIDGGFEGENTLNLLEAKNYLSNDFLIRQLYYPYKLWSSKIKKKVRPIFLTYTNGIFHLREYEFSDASHYNSLILINERKYGLREGAINIETIQKILQNTQLVREPNVPFPQADSFERVINLCELLKEKPNLTKEEITINYDFDERQTNYYTDAARYLGLVDKIVINKKVTFFLTDTGENVFNQPIYDRQLIFVRYILEHEAFNLVLRKYLEQGEVPDRQEVIEIMKSSNLRNVSAGSTFHRRASTVISWITWILNLVEE